MCRSRRAFSRITSGANKAIPATASSTTSVLFPCHFRLSQLAFERMMGVSTISRCRTVYVQAMMVERQAQTMSSVLRIGGAATYVTVECGNVQSGENEVTVMLITPLGSRRYT